MSSHNHNEQRNEIVQHVIWISDIMEVSSRTQIRGTVLLIWFPVYSQYSAR